ncbi:MAG: M14 family metallopeptidase [Melioribacteraceae bacterium]|nr:M14 family metallopeptidase [Melioribacteraceae bacterium]
MKSFFTLIFFLSISIIFSQENDNGWETVFERSGEVSTADYDESIKYFQKIADKSEFAEIFKFGTTPQGRTLYYLVVNKDGNFSPEQNEKPVVFVQNGIHSGEIEGKDACMLMLREILITEEKKNLIENVTLIVIPVLNADGHERKSKYNRINQNGPEEMGWRTTAQNYNLNRDYTKADAPEMQALLKLFAAWLPEVYIDNHTTNGLDFQYVLTYGIEKYQNTRSVLADWTRNEFIPYFENTLNERGVLTAPYFWYLERGNVSAGVTDWVSTPRFSHGYAAYQNRIGLLIETHMLKPYDERVFATKEAIEVVLEYVNGNSDRIVEMVSAADAEAIDEYYHKGKALPIEFESTSDYDEFIFKGFKPVVTESFITGTNITTYSNEKFTDTIKYYSYKEVVDLISASQSIYYSSRVEQDCR